jgi:transcriptional regulator with XRE-family HTH domain
VSNPNKILAKILVRERKQAGLSQEELAENAGLHRTYVSQIERGLKSPTLAVFIKLVHALDLKASDVLAAIEREFDDL